MSSLPLPMSPPSPSSPDPMLTLWRDNLPREHDFERLTVEGRIPAELRGTLFRNGPGQFGQFGQRYGHPFEADGAVTAIRVDDVGATAAVRMTQSRGLLDERAAGRLLYGESAPWHRRILNQLRGRAKNTANTSVMMWQGRLLALMEGSGPTEIDPQDLRTVGETDLDGVITSWFSAHPHRVVSRGTTYNFGLEMGRESRLHLYALPDVGAARHLGAIPLDGPTMLHDFIATDHHLVFFVSPVRVSVPRALLAIGGFADLMQWQPALGTEIIVVPIDRPDAPVRFHVDPFFQWHFCNGFSRGDQLVVDLVRYPDFASFHELGQDVGPALPPGIAAGRYHRAVIDPARRTMTSEIVLDEVCEFPKVNPRVEGAAHRTAWLTLGDLDGIGRLDPETGTLVVDRLPPHQRASEPIFVPRRGARDEADGHLLTLCYDGRHDRSFVAIHDGLHVADGPVARLWLDHRVPITFHGVWAPR